MSQGKQNIDTAPVISSPSRRDVLRTGTAAAVGAALAATYAFPSGVYAKASDTIKIGLVGCGGRGTGAAGQALAADEGTELVAMGDMFADKLEKSLGILGTIDAADRVADGKSMKKFVGWDAYKGVLGECDVVLLATPPHFRPMHVRAAVEAGKHVFCEKPVGTDVPHVKQVIEACKLAKEKNLNIVSGLCYRYDQAKIDTMNKIHDGAIGDIVNLQATYNTTQLWMNPRQPAWDDMQWQLRNWLYFRWLSGDMVVEQSIHSIDKMMWIMHDEPPVKVTSAGGRVQRTSPEFGNIYDHFNSVIEWKNGVRCFQSSRQWNNCDNDSSDWAFGNEGKAEIDQHRITGKNPWHRKPSPINMYDAEHIALFRAIRGKLPTINNGDYMCKSTLVAMACRMSAYTGKTIYWDAEGAKADKAQNPAILLDSKEDLSPPKYAFGPLEVAPIPVPGVTKFI
jgi:predicted dehydrogenase